MMLQHDAIAMLEVHGSRPDVVATRVDRDSSLVAALCRGEPTAADSLVSVYGDRAFRLATRITGNAQDGEEVVQDAFWSVIRKIETFRGDSAFGTWLYRVVANVACQRLRKRRRRSADVSLDTILPVFDEHGRHAKPVADWSTEIDDPACQKELQMLLGAAIEELPADYRTVIVLRDVEELPYQEIAAALGLRVANVKSRLRRARLFLRKRLETHFSMASGARPAPTRTGRRPSPRQAPHVAEQTGRRATEQTHHSKHRKVLTVLALRRAILQRPSQEGDAQ